MKSPVTMELLETLDAIDRRGSFAKAAEELNKATSSVSYTVQKFEEQLDIRLFTRQGRRSVLTPAGQLMLEQGRQILQCSCQLADKVKELATGWEPKLKVGLESAYDYPVFFEVLSEFLHQHSQVEVEVSQCVLNGGWDALAEDKVDLVVGVPGPVPLQMGFRAVALKHNDMLPVIASQHPLAQAVTNKKTVDAALSQIRRVINRDTSVVGVARSAGLSDEGKRIYVQTMEQKIAAIVAGVGAGHLPRKCVQPYLDNGQLVPLALTSTSINDNFLAWKISHKGKALQALARMLSTTR